MKKIKWMSVLCALLCVATLASACGSDKKKNEDGNKDQNNQQSQGGEDKPGNNGTDNEDDTGINIEDSLLIQLNDDKTDVGTSGATYADGVLRITKGGVYRLKGTLTNGQVYITVSKTETVELILDGCTITCKNNAAIYCDSTDKLYITANAGSENTLTDGYNYIYSAVGADEPNACIFSDDDITLRGSGSLSINGNFKNGISSKNDIKIKDLTLLVNAANTGIRGKESVEINSGKVTVVAGKDGLKASQTEDAAKGFVEINGGTVDITAGDDAVQAITQISINGGKVSASYEGKALNCDGEVYTAEGTFTEK